MARAQHSLVVNRPPEDVFAYLTDVRNLPEWQRSVEAAHQEGEGPVVAGTRFAETRRFLGRRLQSTLEVTAHEPGRRLDLKVVEGPVPFEVRHTLQSADGGTRIDVVVEGETGGFFKVADFLVARQGKKQLQEDFGALKRILEARPT